MPRGGTSRVLVFRSYCIDDVDIELPDIVEDGIIVATQDNFLGRTVSGVGIS